MAMEEEKAPRPLGSPRWQLDQSLDTSETWLERAVDLPTKDSVMSDDTVPQSAVEVEMLLNHEDEMEEMRDLLHNEGQEETSMVHSLPQDDAQPNMLTQSSTPQSTRTLEDTIHTPQSFPQPTMLTPMSAQSTPRRRSSRLSPGLVLSSSVNSTSTPQGSISTTINNVASPSPHPMVSTPVPAGTPGSVHTPMGAFLNRTSYFSSAIPSPSLFQAEPSWPRAGTPQRESTADEDMRGASPGVEDRPAVTMQEAISENASQDYEGIHQTDEIMNAPTEMNDATHSMTNATEEMLISPTKPLDETTSPSSPQPINPVSPRIVSSAPPTADLSAIFASPIPSNLQQPTLSPVHLQQPTFQSFALPLSPQPASQPQVDTIVTPPRESVNDSNRLASLSPTATSLLDRLVDPFSPVATPQAPKKQSAFSRSNESAQPSASTSRTRTFFTPPSRVIRIEGSSTVNRVAPLTPTRPPPATPVKVFEGSLVPTISSPPLHPPFPMTPQRNNPIVKSLSAPAAMMSPVKDRSITPTNAVSKIPVPSGSKLNAAFEPAVDHASSSTNNLMSPTFSAIGSPPSSFTSQLRQPSTLRNQATGAASKIPRPGKKPYSKPASRIPKPQPVVNSRAPPVFPASIPITPRQVLQPPPPPAQVSPIKTRRGRAAQNALKDAAPQPKPFITELPPGAIIRQPPAPRIKPKPAEVLVLSPPATEDDDDTPVLSEAEDAVLEGGRASPPVDSGMSPPRSGLLLKSRATRLKEQANDAASESGNAATGSVIPEFTATAPSLNIFPVPVVAPTKKGGRGRNTVQRPMLMPLDATSLRHLTTSNTLRNQEYVCSKVETKVVLKEGKRPASPTTKVKTILEKKKEQQEKDREYRAAARRRLATEDEMEVVDAERKHPRGAGEEEDYETPTKYRIRDEMDVDGGELKKRVKWDKDLLQRFEPEDAIDLEEIKSRAGLARTKTASKSCLPTQILLDPLGNVPEAHVPIANLKKEEVIVTRLVYIEDLPPSERPKRVAASKASAKITPAS